MLRPGRNTNLGQKTFSRHWQCQKDQGGLATSPDCGALHVPLSLFQRLSGKRGRSKMLTPPWGQDTAAPPQNSSVAWGSSRAVFVPLFPHFNGDAVKVSTLKISRQQYCSKMGKWMKQGQVQLCEKLGYENASLQLQEAVNWAESCKQMIQTWTPETHLVLMLKYLKIDSSISKHAPVL